MNVIANKKGWEEKEMGKIVEKFGWRKDEDEENENSIPQLQVNLMNDYVS